MTPRDPNKGDLRNPVMFLALGFGSGLAVKAPGTWGTLAAVPLVAAIGLTNPWIYGAALLLCCLSGIWICGYAARRLGVHDHGAIVWDEVAGYMLTLAFVPMTPLNLLLGFILFRVFDILKPWPIRWLDRRVHGGLGIMVDDLLAGVFAGGLLFLMWSRILQPAMFE